MNIKDEADRLASLIVVGERPAVAEGLYVDDVLLQAREFLLDVDVVRPSDMFPCVRRKDDTLVPVALGRSASDYYVSSDYALLSRFAFADDDLRWVSLKQARDTFYEGMVRFLTSRIGSLKTRSARLTKTVPLKLPKLNSLSFGTSKVSTTGFSVDVSASPGLRVHVSPTFRRSWRYFGSPTTPVKGALPGGIYEFGVDGGAYAAITPDTGTFDIPYATVSPVLAL